MNTKSNLFVMLTVWVCFLSGCTATTESNQPTTTISVDRASVDGEKPSTDGSRALTDDVPQGSYVVEMILPPPLVEYGVYLDGPGEDPVTTEARRQRHDNIENSTTVCMSEQGFKYTPVPFQENTTPEGSRMSLALRYLPIPALADERDVVSKYGYGIMASPEERMAAEGVGDNPNVAHTATLGPEEYEAYYFALYGDYSDPAGTSGNSCSGKALTAYPELTDVMGSDRQQQFMAEFGDLVYGARIDVASDPRTIQLDAEWDSCMEQRGFVLERGPGEHGPVLALGQAIRTRIDGSVGPFAYEPVYISDIPVEEKSLLGTASERPVALADYDCRVETDYMARITEIRVSLDEAFINEHKEELDRLKAAADTW